MSGSLRVTGLIIVKIGCQRNSTEGIMLTLCVVVAEYQIQVGLMQGIDSTCCTIAPAIGVIFLIY